MSCPYFTSEQQKRLLRIGPEKLAFLCNAVGPCPMENVDDAPCPNLAHCDDMTASIWKIILQEESSNSPKSYAQRLEQVKQRVGNSTVDDVCWLIEELERCYEVIELLKHEKPCAFIHFEGFKQGTEMCGRYSKRWGCRPCRVDSAIRKAKGLSKYL